MYIFKKEMDSNDICLNINDWRKGLGKEHYFVSDIHALALVNKKIRRRKEIKENWLNFLY